MSKKIRVSAPSEYGIWSLEVYHGNYIVFTALCSKESGLFAAWFTAWVTDFDRYERNEVQRDSHDPEADVRRMLGSLAGPFPIAEAA